MRQPSACRTRRGGVTPRCRPPAAVSPGGAGFPSQSLRVHYRVIIMYDDPDHSDDEDRYLLVGPSARLRILVVIRCVRDSDEVIRIVSARRATQRERDAFVAARSR